ncbi:MAG TPA: glycosyltransferase, partial [Flavisolibacter sp.]|nr:glycosyltransferase [Flavisolibacter sp.]
MELLVQKGHEVVLLTTCEKGYLHKYMENLGVHTEAVELKAGSSKLSFYITNLIKLRSVIKKYKIDIVIAHQQVPALIAGLLRKVNPFRLIYVR